MCQAREKATKMPHTLLVRVVRNMAPVLERQSSCVCNTGVCFPGHAMKYALQKMSVVESERAWKQQSMLIKKDKRICGQLEISQRRIVTRLISKGTIRPNECDRKAKSKTFQQSELFKTVCLVDYPTWKTHCVILKVIMATHYIIIKLNKNVVCFPHIFIRCDSVGCALLVKKILQVHKLWKWSCLLEATPPEPEQDMVGAGVGGGA